MNRFSNQDTPPQQQRLQTPATHSDSMECPDERHGPGAAHDGLPARPLIALVAAIHHRTGDSVATIAKGLCVDQAWLRSVLAGRTSTVDTAQVTAVCNALHFSPFELWDRADVIRVFHHQDRLPPEVSTHEPLLRQGGPGEPPELVW